MRRRRGTKVRPLLDLLFKVREKRGATCAATRGVLQALNLVLGSRFLAGLLPPLPLFLRHAVLHAQ